MLPESWKVTTIGAEFDIQLGKMLNKEAKAKYPQYKYLTNVNVRWGSFDLSDLNEMYFSEADQKKFTLKKGDLLVCEGGEIGRCAIWQDELENCFYQKALHRVRAKADASVEFLKSFLEYNVLNNKLVNLVGRTSIAHLPKEKLEAIPLALPPLAEQKKIAEILSTWDEAISVVDKQLENCRQQKKALMQQLLTGKKRLPGFAGEWKKYSIGELLYEADGSIPWSDEQYYNLLSVKRRSEGVVLRETLQGTKILTKKMNEVASGDFIISKMQVVHGAWGMVPECYDRHHVSDSYIILRPKKNKLYIPFFDYFCSQKIMYHKALQSSYGVHIEKMTFNLDLFMLEKISIPSDIEEQKEIYNLLNCHDQMCSSLEQKKNALLEEKKSLMQQLLTGKKRVAV